MKLATHLHLLPRLRENGGIPPHTFVAWTQIRSPPAFNTSQLRYLKSITYLILMNNGDGLLHLRTCPFIDHLTYYIFILTFLVQYNILTFKIIMYKTMTTPVL
jgi:hypothetical protein